jgi:type II secretory pathway component PulJ
MLRRAFSLVEMLLATALLALMMGGVLMLLGGVNRDMRTMQRQPTNESSVLIELMARDIANASSVRSSDSGTVIELLGNVGIDPRTRRTDGRLARVVYRIDPRTRMHREQVYLDDSNRPQPWSGLAATGVQGVALVRESRDALRARLVLATHRGTTVRELRLR